MTNPDAILSRVVDFGDGTYGVNLADNYYRVDNRLVVARPGNPDLNYVSLGSNGSIWPIMEKAFAHYRDGDNSYNSIEWFCFDVFNTVFEAQDAEQIWFNMGAGTLLSPEQISSVIRQMMDEVCPDLGHPVHHRPVPAAGDSAPVRRPRLCTGRIRAGLDAHAVQPLGHRRRAALLRRPGRRDRDHYSEPAWSPRSAVRSSSLTGSGRSSVEPGFRIHDPRAVFRPRVFCALSPIPTVPPILAGGSSPFAGGTRMRARERPAPRD